MTGDTTEMDILMDRVRDRAAELGSMIGSGRASKGMVFMCAMDPVPLPRASRIGHIPVEDLTDLERLALYGALHASLRDAAERMASGCALMDDLFPEGDGFTERVRLCLDRAVTILDGVMP